MKLTGWTVSMPKIKPISDGLGFSIDLEAMIERQRTRKFECHECESLFDTIDQLRDHLMKNHLTGERFIHHFADTVKTPHTDQVCETCETIFSSKKKLIRHVRSVHYLQKVPCTQCGSSFQERVIWRDIIKSVMKCKVARTIYVACVTPTLTEKTIWRGKRKHHC